MAIELDIGPLTWVKGEIDQALERARENLAGFSDNPSDVSPLRFCQTHLHQVTGAIQMVGLEGAARVSDEIEKGVAALGKQEAEPSPANIEAIGQAIQALAKYLADLLDGEPDVPLKLFPVYKSLHQVRGATDFAESDLFFPDLSVRAPKDPEARPVPEAELPALAREKRTRYQKGLLKFLQDSDDRKGMEAMRSALLALERAQALPAQRTFWWAAGGLVESLINKGLDSDLEAKRLLGKVDQQIRRVAEASPKVAERVLRDVLYRVARSKPVSERVKQVKHVFELDDCLPQTAAADTDAARFKPLLRELKEPLASTKDAWLKFATGHKDSLKALQKTMPRLAEKIQALENAPLRELFQQMQLVVAAQTEQGAAEPVALEMATALLLAESTLENFGQVGDDLASQLGIQTRRMQALLGGRQDEIDAAEIPHLGDISRKAQEKMLLAQVAQEIQVNLRRIEEVLDAFFRDASKRDSLPALDPVLKQVSGALKILELEQADKLLGICHAGIRNFETPAYLPAAQELEAVAEGLSSLGFYIEALQLGRPEAERIVEQTLARLTGEPEETAAVAPGEADAERPEESVEASLGAQKNLAQESFDAWQAQPENTAARRKLESTLSGLAQDAELVADAELKEQTAAVQRLLEETCEAPVAALAGAVSALAEAKSPPVTRSKEAERLLDASEEAVDAELLETYLEEAAEVLAAVAENLQICQASPDDREAMTTIRRGFHTLKGSGRMVGLTELGEVAWAVEQVLNKWLQEERGATPALLDFVAQARDRFEYWVGQLRTAGCVGVDADALLAQAEQLKRGPESAEVAPAPVEAASAAVEPEIALAPIEVPPEETPATDVPETEPVALDLAEAPGVELEAPVEAPVPEQAAVVAEEIVLPAVAELAAPVEDAELAAAAPPAEAEVAIGDVSLSSALLDIYMNEARQRLAALQAEFAQLEEHPEYPIRHDFMRAAHTLCGISRTVGFSAPAELSFEFEALLRQMLEHPQPANGKQLGVMGDVIVALRKMVQSIEEQQLPKPAKQLIRSVQALVKKARAEAEKAAPRAPVPAAEAPEQAGIAARPVLLPTSRDDIDAEILPLFLEEAHDLIPLVGTQLRAWRGAPAGDQAPQNLQRTLHTLKGSARMAGALQLGDLVHNMETRVIAALDGAYPTAAYFDELDVYFDRIGDGLELLQAKPATPAVEAPTAQVQSSLPAPSPIQLPAAAKSGEQQLRVRADVVDRLVNEAGEISIARSRVEGEMQGVKQSLLELTENVIRLRNQVREIEIQAEGRMQSQSNQGGAAEAFDPLEFDRFTRFQELTRFLAESVNDVATVQQNLLKSLGEVDAALLQQARLNRELQQELMHIRMVPLSSIAERLHRIVRQTARELGKKATLEINGGQVELDRSVLDKMTAPFEHLLRNALAHGVETAGERLGAGKPEAGTIRIEARQVGNEIVLTLGDDGSGFDLAGIRRRAVDLGKLAADSDVVPAQLIDMMFDPGFSTAREVTQVAGRGIGLDVVRSEITGLGGRIEAAPGVNGGANFTIYLPLTLAVAQAVLVRVGEKVYALPSAMVEQVQEFKAAALEGVFQKGEIEWLGNRYALFYLPRLLGDRDSAPEQHRYSVTLLLRSGSQRIAVLVDEILGNREIVVKNIGPQLARIPGIAGATVLGNGQVALIINPVPLAQRYLLRDAAAAPQAAMPADLGIAAAPLIMVVDDSLTVRKITSRLLLKEGYQVVTAKDGVDALQQLQETLPAVMLVDIEMPRMDGFELTKNVRGDVLTAHIPIIMITSRTADKHRNYARELGVNAYLGKPFQEEELLGHIAGFVKG
ncbi:MAG: Hpt domain-containing protein [Sulfuricella sp.]|nr:Hpt domain-containing protein [Sulfuricella sp.]